MSEFVFELEEEVALEAEATGGSFGVLETDVYPLTVVHASISQTKGGNNIVALSIKTKDGHECTIYQAFMIDKTWSTGSENFLYKDWQSFAQVAGMKTGERGTFRLTKKDGSLIKELDVFKELEGKDMTLAIQKKLDFYKGEVRESNIVHSSYSIDGKSLSEMIGKTEAVKMAKVADRLADKKTKAYRANAGSVSAPQEEENTGSLLD